MAASKKKIEDAKRLKYIRALERFAKTVQGFLHNTQEVTHQSYMKKIDNALKVLQRVESTQLYKGELQELEKLVEKMIGYRQSEDDIQQIKADILYSCNQLEKSKKHKKYKKEKHAHSKYEEWE